MKQSFYFLIGLSFVSVLIIPLRIQGQTVTISANPGSSNTTAMGINRYHVSEHLYLQSEIDPQLSLSPLYINFIRLKAISVGSITSFTNIKIYLKQTTSSTLSSGQYTLSSYTQVYNGTISMPSAGNYVQVNITPFVYSNLTGSNLEMLIIRTDNTLHSGFTFSLARGESGNSNALTSRNYNGTTSPQSSSTLLTSTNQRANIQFGSVPCSGVPNPGNTLASINPVCISSTTILTLQNAISGSNVNYQWQKSSDGINFIDIMGATSSSYNAFLDTPYTYKRCKVSCLSSSSIAYSNPIHLLMQVLSTCYCTPQYQTSFGGTYYGQLISNVSIAGTTLSNNSGNTNGTPSWVAYLPPTYTASNYTANLAAGDIYTLSVTTGASALNSVGIWMDMNDDGVFSSSEVLAKTENPVSAAGSNIDFPIVIPCTTPVGSHRMRVRNMNASYSYLIDPCASFGFGECEDYLITVTTAIACPVPTHLTAQNIDYAHATYNWNIGCAETDWTIEYGPSGFTHGNGSLVNVSGSPTVNISGLNCETNYQVYVSANCSGNGMSPWFGPISFSTTTCPCTGIPTPGNTLAPQTVLCDYQYVTLSLQYPSQGATLSYQWQRSMDGLVYTNMPNDTASTLTTYADTPYTYKRCRVTCNASGLSAYSNPIQLILNTDPISCICVPLFSDTSFSYISRARINSYFNPLDHSSGIGNSGFNTVSSYTNSVPPAELFLGEHVYYYLNTNNASNHYAAMYIDFNHSGTFDPGEFISLNPTFGNYGADYRTHFYFPTNVDTGLTVVRFILNYGSAPNLNMACNNPVYGEAEDYLIHVIPSIHLTIKAFIQGFYIGNQSITPRLSNANVLFGNGIADSLTVEIHAANSPYTLLYLFKGYIDTNGYISADIPGWLDTMPSYVVIKHQNGLETWSAQPVIFTSSTLYDFTAQKTSAYGDNLIEVEPNTWAIYSGDINQDEAIDAFDYLILDPDVIAGNSGYLASDLNGDGVVDAFDYLLLDPNLINGISTVKP